MDPGTAQFTPTVRTQLLEASERAIAVRHRTLSYVEAEVAELERLRTSFELVATLLADVRTGQGPFDRRVETVRQARHVLDRLCEIHQAYIHDRPRRRYEPLIQSVYADFDVEYPGLAALAAAVGHLESVELRLWAGADDERAAGDS